MVQLIKRSKACLPGESEEGTVSSARLGFSLRDGFSAGELDSPDRPFLSRHISIFAHVHQQKILTWSILNKSARGGVQRQNQRTTIGTNTEVSVVMDLCTSGLISLTARALSGTTSH